MLKIRTRKLKQKTKMEDIIEPGLNVQGTGTWLLRIKEEREKKRHAVKHVSERKLMKLNCVRIENDTVPS